MKSPLGRRMAWKGAKMQSERSSWQPLLVLYKLARLIKATCKRLYIRNRNPLHSLRIFYNRERGPNNLRIEASSKCQLHCSGCCTGDGSNRQVSVGWGDLHFENFKKLIDHNPRVKKIELSNWGGNVSQSRFNKDHGIRFSEEDSIDR